MSKQSFYETLGTAVLAEQPRAMTPGEAALAVPPRDLEKLYERCSITAEMSAPAPKAMLLSADPAERKQMPITTGVLDYFPLAMAEVSRVSKAGNDQHNPGQPLHWDKTKSLDHADCISRHLIDRGSRDTDGMRHSAKLVWRALALLETELEREREQA